MHLEEIELFGFKTFVSNTKIILSKNITAIVGPNGSGKSNVVDAIRWILGETKFTLLRATESADLIFSGSSSKSPLNVASVKMIFNNEDHKLPIKTPRFVIERRIYRNKESHYYVNGEESSLQNVLSIFNSGGIFGANFAIVGQGRVEEILLARPEEKKAILDKVAGIERFRKRREEALKKLQETDENLVRVYDRLSELRHNAERTVSEAKKAHLYYMLVDKLKILEATFYVSRIAALNKEIALINIGLESFNSEKEEINTLISNKKKEFEEIHGRLIVINNQYDSVKQKMNEYRIESAHLVEKENALRDKIAMLENKQAENKLRIEKLLRTSKYILEDLKKAATEKSSKEEKLSTLRNEEIDIANSLETLKAELEPFLSEESEVKERITKLTEERIKKEKIISSLSTDIRYLSNELASIERLLEETSYKKTVSEEEILSKMNSARSKKDLLQKELSELYEERSLLRYRINENKKSIVDTSEFDFPQGTIGALLNIKKLVPGIEEELKAQVIRSFEDLNGKDEGMFFVDQSMKGRNDKLGKTDDLPIFVDERAKPINEFIGSDSIYLKGIYYAESLANALDVFRNYVGHYFIRKIITQDGFVVLSPFQILANSSITSLKKQEKIEELVALAEEADTKISKLQVSIENIDNDAKNLERDLAKARLVNEEIRNSASISIKAEEIKKKIKENESRIELESENIKSIITSMSQFSFDEKLSLLRETFEKKKDTLRECSSQIREIEFEIKAAEHDIDEKRRRIDSIKSEIEDVEKLNNSDVRLLEQELRDAIDKLSSLSLTIAELDDNEKNLKKSISEFNDKENTINIDISRLSEQRETLARKIEKANIQIAQKQTEFEALKREMKEKELQNSNTLEKANIEKIKEEINILKQDISDIGLIDFTSVDDEEKILTELNEKESVYKDVKSAKKELEKFIDETDEKIKLEFENTLSQVEGYFKEFFRRLFLGGEASIDKLYDDEGTVKGIELNVRLPGKRKQSLSVLSGGEKTITALSFLFALFKVKPSPFYVLDEVDAALDEDNVVRFSELIQEEAKNSQFIIITHNKETMQRADILYGITMEEEGISKVVSMKLV